MHLIFKLKAWTLDRRAHHAFPAPQQQSWKTRTASVAAAARCINTVAAVCVCVFSAAVNGSHSNKDHHHHHHYDGKHNNGGIEYADDDDDFDDYDDVNEENIRRRLAAFDPYDEEDAMLADMFGDARSMQRHEVEQACRMGMSVSLLEELWMEKIVIELQKIVGKRRRRVRRLVRAIDGRGRMIRMMMCLCVCVLVICVFWS